MSIQLHYWLRNCQNRYDKVIATNCTISLIHPITDVNYRASLNIFDEKTESVELNLEQDKFERLLYEETLTVLFSANLIYFGAPNQSFRASFVK